jgi:hypothetical protein
MDIKLPCVLNPDRQNAEIKIASLDVIFYRLRLPDIQDV